MSTYLKAHIWTSHTELTADFGFDAVLYLWNEWRFDSCQLSYSPYKLIQMTFMDKCDFSKI